MDRIGKYSIIGELGKGAMGIVYEGWDPYIERKVAIKTIRFDTISEPFEQEEATKRFIREARSAGILSHPNIVTIYDVGEDAGLTYIAMQFIDGKSLEEIIASREKYSLDEITNLMAQIGNALDYAHGEGIVHRDIKPGNILIDNEGMAHIVDFGIARITTSTLTQTGMSLGTPNYMSPEQVMGKKVDHRADIFSVGAILFELLTKEKPFRGENVTNVIYKIVHENPPALRNFDINIPEGLEYVVGKALAKAPKSRYQSCQELIEDLMNYPRYAGVPVAEEIEIEEEIPEQRIFPEFQKEKRKRPLLILLASMMIVVMTVVIAVFLYTRSSKQSDMPGPGGSVSGPASIDIENFFNAFEWHLQNKRYPEAIAELKKILAVDPQNFEAQLGIANILKEQGKIDEAILEYDKLIALNNRDLRPYQQLGDIYETKQDLKRAVEYFKLYLSHAPEGFDIGKIEQKINDLETQIQGGVPQKPQITGPSERDRERAGISDKLNLGVIAFNQGDYDQCIDQMEDILKLDPENESAKYYLAEAKKRLKEIKVKGILELAIEAFQNQNYQESIRQSKIALSLDPNNAEAKKYLNQASLRIASRQVRDIFNRYVQSVKNKTLSAFYRQACTPGVYLEQKEDAELLFGFYDNLKIAVSNYSVQFKNNSRAEVKFSHMITGVYRADGNRRVLSEGTVRWDMNRQGDQWKIVDIQILAQRKR